LPYLSTPKLLLTVLVCAAMTCMAPQSGFSQSDPATQLQRFQPDLFNRDNTQNAAVWGMQAVHVVALNSGLTALGFQENDYVLAVQGQPLHATLPAAGAGNPVYTVLRSVPGDRPVLEASIVGRRMLTDFTGLDVAERTPMRLTRMVANGWTLMQEGRGVLLLPDAAGRDDAAWLQFATPLPGPAESGVQKVAQGVKQRADLPVVADEADAARQAFRGGDVLVAQERAGRAVLQWITDPQQRVADAAFTSLVQLYIDATLGVAERRQELLQPAPRFGVFGEGSYSFIQAFLPQQTLITVENSSGWSARAGVRMRLFRWLDVLGSYGYSDNSFEDAQGRTKIATTLQPVLLELAYRPVVLSRLKPVLRAGFGAYILHNQVYQDDGTKVVDLKATTWGLEFGGGVDAFYLKRSKLRGTVQLSFRLLEYLLATCPEGGDCETALWPRAQNQPPGSALDPANPLRFLEVQNPPRYKLNMNGWTLGFMLTRDF
jgi:hypothetical protein